MVAHADQLTPTSVTTASGVLELTCLVVNVKHIIVCGHSDCKAIHALYGMKEGEPAGNSCLKMWLQRAGAGAVSSFKEWKASNLQKPFELHLEHPKSTIRAYIDPENRFGMEDKFSQINTLVQFKNISSYDFLHDRLDRGLSKMVAMWFDVRTGDFFMFSEKEERFVEITTETYDSLLQEQL